jgi:hypothetical protein
MNAQVHRSIQTCAFHGDKRGGIPWPSAGGKAAGVFVGIGVAIGNIAISVGIGAAVGLIIGVVLWQRKGKK